MNKDLILYGGLAVGGFILANSLMKTINPKGDSLASNIGNKIVVSTLDAGKEFTVGAVSGAWNYELIQGPALNLKNQPIENKITIGDLIFPLGKIYRDEKTFWGW